MAAILVLLALQTQVTGSIFGAVLDTSGQPIPHAVVSIASSSRHARTDSLGVYQLKKVPAGSIRITAWALGYETRSVESVVTAGKSVEVDFVLFARNNPVRLVDRGKGSLVVTLRDSANHRVIGSTVYLTSEPHRQLIGDSLGHYRLDSIPPGRVAVESQVLGFRTRIDTVIVRPGETTHVELILDHAPPLLPVIAR